MDDFPDRKRPIVASIAPCLQSGSNIVATVRVMKNGTNGTLVEGLTAYDQTGSIRQTCTTSATEEENVLELTITFDPSNPICGIEQNGTKYNIQVHAQGYRLNQPFKFTCDSSSLTSQTVSYGPLTVQGSLPVFPLYERRRALKLQAVDTGGSQLPTNSLELGQDVQLRIVYDKGEKEPDGAWGYTFHIGFLKTIASVDLKLVLYAEDLGTRVKITGNLPGAEVDQMLYVLSGIPETYTLPHDYQPTGTVTTWIKENKGIQIEALDHRIGVKVITNSDSASTITGTYIAVSDSALGTSYRLPSSFNPAASDGQALVIGIADGTTVTLTYDDFTTSGITIAGTPLAADSDTVSLDENQSFHIVCGLTCKRVSLTSSEPVAVITGNGNDAAPGSSSQAGYMISQVPPTSQFSTRFILLNLRGSLSRTTSYQLLSDSPVFTGTANTFQIAAGSVNFDDSSGNEIELTANVDSVSMSAGELETDVPVIVSQFTTSGITGNRGPAMETVPSINQWGFTQTLLVRSQMVYDVIIVSAKGAMDNILVSAITGEPVTVAQFCFGLSDTFSILVSSGSRQDVTPISGDVNYEFVFCQMSFHPEVQWLNFDGSVTSHRLWVVAYEYGSSVQNAFNGIGLRYSNLKPCIPIQPQDPGSPIYPGVIIGDGVDNDCDGQADEEAFNDIDDDIDGRIDEDLAVEKLVEHISPFAVRNLKLEVSGWETFPVGQTLPLIEDGCNIGESPSVGHFKAVNVLIAGYPVYWILQTNIFPAFKVVNSPSLYFRATVDFCDSGTGFCADCCIGTRRKRSSKTSAGTQETVILRLDITDKPETDESVQTASSCLNDPLYWCITIVFIIIIIFEIVTIKIFTKMINKYLK